MAIAEIDSVYRMAMYLVRRPNEAEDLVQETFLRALKAENGFELRERGIKPWLFKILHNVHYTRLDRERRAPALTGDLEIEVVAGGLNDSAPCWDLSSLDWEQVDDKIKQAIEQLPVHYREVLLLWAVEGLKYREIADVLSVALGTVMSRLYRAREILSQQLAPLAAERGIPIGSRTADQDNG